MTNNMRKTNLFLIFCILFAQTTFAAILPGTLGNGIEGIAYNEVLFTSDKVNPKDSSIRWKVLQEPPGIKMDPKGKYVGKPLKSGNYTLQVIVYQAVGSRLDLKDSATIKHTINATTPPKINGPLTLPSGKYDQRYQQIAGGYRLTATSDYPFPPNSQYPSGFIWEDIKASEFQSLPKGLNLDPRSGVITGTPTGSAPIPASNQTYTFRVKATDMVGKFATANFTLVVNRADPPEILSQCPMPEGLETLNYSAFTLRGAKGKAPYSWFISPRANFAPGLTIDSRTGVISGKPTRYGTYNFNLVLQDSNGLTANKTCSITIRPAPEIVVKPIFQCAQVGGSACDEIEALGGDQPYSWSATGLPGITINSTSGSKARICGNFTQAGNFTVSVTARDKTGRVDIEQFVFQVRPQLALTSSCPLDVGVQNSYYSANLTATGGKEPYSWALEPPNKGLPSGLTLNSTSGRISGTPISYGNFTFSYRVTDSCGKFVTANCSVTINPPLAQPSCSPPCITEGVPLSPTGLFSASGGKPPYTYDAPSTLPPGLNFSAGGILSGTPSSAGNLTISTTIRDSLGNSKPAICFLLINPVLQITSLALPPAKMGEAYSAILTTTGGFGQKTWALAPPNNTLPPNLSLNPLTGVISGTPQTTGEFKVNLSVTDSCGSASNATAEIDIFVSNVGSAFLPCGKAANAGGVGQFNYIVDLGASSGQFSFSGNALSIPDRFVLRFGNSILLDTGSFSGLVNQTFIKSASQRWLTIETDAPIGGTAWTFTVSCATPTPAPIVAVQSSASQIQGSVFNQSMNFPFKSLFSLPTSKLMDFGLSQMLPIFSISITETTFRDYCEFLNSVASEDTFNLYNPSMQNLGISRTGSMGSFSYTVDSDCDDYPVTHVSWFDAARYANWLANGKPVGSQDSSTTEDGVYRLASQPISRNTINPNTGNTPVFWLLNENEWYASAYLKSDASGLWTYPTQSNSMPDSTGSNPANFANFGGVFGETTPVGFFSQSPGPFGTFDQAGNVREWTETLDSNSGKTMRIIRGGSWADPASAMRADESHVADPTLEDDKTGFRIGGAP